MFMCIFYDNMTREGKLGGYTMAHHSSAIPTPHIQALEGEIASVVLMPGDPLRAKYIAESFLENITCFNNVRGMLGYTGEYKGHKVSVMGSGMGMPSIGIYSYELYKFYNVDTIIRVGSCGSYDADLGVYELLLARAAFSRSTYARCQQALGEDMIYPSESVNSTIIDTARELELDMRVEFIHSSDVFYAQEDEIAKLGKIIKDRDIKAVEMESFALFANAKILGKRAACLLTVSDNLVTGCATTAQERQSTFTNMMKLSLESAIRLI